MEKLKLKDCCQIIAGQSPQSRYYNTDGVGLPFFQGKADFGDLYPSINTYCSKPIKIAEKDDILLSVRAPVGPTNLSPEKVCIGRGLSAIRPDERVNLKYLLHYFRYYQAQLELKGTGTTFSAITQEIVRNIEIPVPSLRDQECIANRIEELFSELDKGVETLITIKKQLEVYRQAVLKNAFRNSQRIKTNEVCVHITDGDHMPPPKAQVGIPFVMISNIKGNQIDWENTHFVDSDYYSQIGEKRTPCIGDVLYTVTGSFGIPVLVDFNQKFCFQRHIALLRPNTSISQKFLYYALQTPDVLQQAAHRATGTAQKTVGLAVLRDLDIPFEEDLNEQNHIVSRIESQLSLYDSILKTVNSALEQAESMRKSILKQAFEGRLI